jgi:homoserine kinase type II
MTHRSDIEIALIPEILSFFGFDPPEIIAPVTLGISNHNYVVTTQQDEFVVKFLINQPVETVENDVATQKSLANAGIWAPRYLCNRDGITVFDRGPHRAVVSRRIHGVVPETMTINLAREFGRLLAGFHMAVTYLPQPNTRGLMNPGTSGIKSPLFSRALPTGIIHGDFHAGNALVDLATQERIIAICDFEEAGENVYIVDLAVTVMGVCSYDENVMDIALIRALIQGYETLRPLSTREHTYFPEALQYAAHSWIQWFLANGYEKYARNHQTRLEMVMQIFS